MASKGPQYSASLGLTANIQGNISKEMEAGVKQAQAGVRKGVRSGANAAAQESSKTKRRFGNMMFEASRAAEDFGQQLSVSFDQAVRASANNITQMVAVSGNQYAAMATSVAVALYFMLDPIKELIGATRQWGEELAIVEGRIKRVKESIAKKFELEDFEQELVSGLDPMSNQKDKWESQEESLKQQLKKLTTLKDALIEEQNAIINAQKEYHEMGVLEAAAPFDQATKDKENALMRRLIGFSDEDLAKLKSAKKAYNQLVKSDRILRDTDVGLTGVAEPVELTPDEIARRQHRRKQAELFLENTLKRFDLPQDTNRDLLDKIIAQMEKDDPIMKSQRSLGKEITDLKKQEVTLNEKLNLFAKHGEGIEKARLKLTRERLDAMRQIRTLAQEDSLQEYDILRGLGPFGSGVSLPAAPVDQAGLPMGPSRSGVRRLANGRLIGTGTRGGVGDLAASGIGVRQPRTAREWRELGVRHASVGQAPNQPGRWIMHQQPGSEFLDPEIVRSSPWIRRGPLGYGARTGSGRAGDPLRNVVTGYMHGAPIWGGRESRSSGVPTGLSNRQMRRFRASRGGGTASDIVNRPPMRIIEQIFGAGAATVSNWMDSTEFWQGGDRGAAFVPAYPGARAGSIGTSPSSAGMTWSQSRLVDALWTESGRQRSRYGADADLDVQRGSDLRLDQQHPVMSPQDQLRMERSHEIEEQSSQYLQSISQNISRMAQQRTRTATIAGSP